MLVSKLNLQVPNSRFYASKNFPNVALEIPQTRNQQFMKKFISFGGLGRPDNMLQRYVGVLLECWFSFFFAAFELNLELSRFSGRIFSALGLSTSRAD